MATIFELEGEAGFRAREERLLCELLQTDGQLIASGGGAVLSPATRAAMQARAFVVWLRVDPEQQLARLSRDHTRPLLAMVDSSVGGKTAVDLPGGKNLVGAFHQPAAVVADTDTLTTLPDRELRAGLAEVVKAAAIGDAPLLSWLEQNADALLARDPAALRHAIAASVRYKAGVVARDETEQGERMLLNFGHTFGHAIETEQGYGGLLHGEAVAVGMVLAARLSARLGWAGATDGERLQALLDRLGLPTALPAGLDATALVQRMRLDKKAVSGRLRLVLWRGVGRAEVASDVAEDEVAAVLG